MKAKPKNRLYTRTRCFGIWGMLLSAGTWLGNQTNAAQNVIGLQAPPPLPQTEDQQAQPDEMNVFQPAGGPVENSLPQIFQYGPLKLHPSASYSIMDGSGIQSAPGSQQDSIVQSLSLGFLVDIGPHWVFDYSPSFEFYSNKALTDTVNHNISLNGGLEYGSWKWGFSQDSSYSTSPLVESGGETTSWNHSTGVNATRILTSNISADFSLSQNINLVDGVQNSFDWSTSEWLNYQFWARLSAGIGVSAGYVMIEDESQTRSSVDLDQIYESANARLNWRATDKISFALSAGVEDRQFMTPGTENSPNPIFSATIQYAPLKATQVSMSASRSVSSSDYYIIAQQSETTTVSLNLDQRLFKKFSLGLGASYSTTDYSVSAGSFGGASRTDDSVSLSARLSHSFFKRGTWSIFYQYSDNSSSASGYTFASNQTGIEISYSY